MMHHSINPHVLNEARCLLGIVVCACCIIVPWWLDRRRMARWRRTASGQTTLRRYPR